ncbi:MAG TPA: PIG-L deacetylase family protein [Gaiella sp.]|jgi:LmbE family N-acetylglucosaminyl deacetylase|nr:PIG-L deacetylase family protein [Gaiella sp.]
MLPLGFAGGSPLGRLLAIGAHSDDLEIGCGGTVLALTRANPGLAVHWVVLAANGDRADEARRCAETLLADAGERSVEVHEFRDGYLPHTAAEVKDTFEALKARVAPDLVLTHTRDDLHQDHRLVCELTWNTFRDNVILEYEIPKWDGDVGRPNVYVPLDESVAEEKLQLLGGHFDTQRGKDWYDVDVFRGLMRIRGMECRAQSGYAEAFTARKVTLEMSGGKGST